MSKETLDKRFFRHSRESGNPVKHVESRQRRGIRIHAGSPLSRGRRLDQCSPNDNSASMPRKERLSLADFWQLAKLREHEGQLSAPRQLLEELILYPFYGVGPSYYQLAGFWERSSTWYNKTHHLSRSAFERRLDKLNPINYRKLSGNKLAEKALLKLLAIPTPEYLGYYDPAVGSTADGAPLTGPNQLDDYLRQRRDLKRICFKPIEQSCGRGFEPVEIHHNSSITAVRRLRTHATMTVRDFCQDILGQGYHASGSVIERLLNQHTVLAALNPSSVNTLRIWALQKQDASVEIPLAYLRIGRAGSPVDNQSSGGIVAPIDLHTGRLQAAVDGIPSRCIFPAHPDHGATIAGVELPFFVESLQLAKRSIRGFPNTRFAGLDVAVAADGPRIIELNVEPDQVGAAFTNVPAKDLLS